MRNPAGFAAVPETHNSDQCSPDAAFAYCCTVYSFSVASSACSMTAVHVQCIEVVHRFGQAGLEVYRAALTSCEQMLMYLDATQQLLMYMKTVNTTYSSTALMHVQGIGPVSRAQYLQMIGRAGRAGHAAVGEAYIIGQGSPDAAFGDWKAICDLLVAPVPSVHSQLLAEGAFVNDPSSCGQSALALTKTPSLSSHTVSAPSQGVSGASQVSAVQPSQLLRSRQSASEAGCSQQGVTQRQHSSTTQHLQGYLQHGKLHSAHCTQQDCTQRDAGYSSHGLQPACSHQACAARPISGQVQHVEPQAHSSQQAAAAAAAAQKEIHSHPAMVQLQTTQQAAAHGPHGLLAQANATLPLQRMLLEAVANKSIQSLQDILTLASSTLLCHQAQSDRVKRAIKSSLQTLE